MGAIVAIVVAAIIGLGAAAGGSVLLVSAQPNRVGHVPVAASDSSTPGTTTPGTTTSDPNADIVQYGNH